MGIIEHGDGVPAVDSARNKTFRDVIGNKSDTLGGTSLMSQIEVTGASAGHHEHTYPHSDGEGGTTVAIIITTDAEDDTTPAGTDQYYWGEPKIIVPVSTITVTWLLSGFYFSATTTGKDLVWEMFRIKQSVSAVRNVGNAWDEGATVLTVDSATGFATNDKVLILTPGYAPDGEILKITDVTGPVITVARETVQTAATGLRWDHTINDGGNEVMYLIEDPSSSEMHPSSGRFGASSAKDEARITLDGKRTMTANDGLIMRSLNETDGATATFSASVIYDDEVGA